MSLALDFINNLKEYDVKIDNYFDFEKSSISEIEEKNPVVSFSENGNPLSYWNDDVWNFNLFSNKNNDGLINFSNYKTNLSSVLFSEFKLLTLVLSLKKLNKSTNARIIKTTATELFTFFDSAQRSGMCSIVEINNSEKFTKLLEIIDGKYTYGTLKQKFINLRQAENLNLSAIRMNVGFEQKKRVFNKFNFSVDGLSKKYAKHSGKEIKQTLCIPQRIHTEIVSNAVNIIKRNMKDIKKIETFLELDYLEYEKAIKQINEDQYYHIKSRSEQKNRVKWLRKNKNSNLLSSIDILNQLNLNKRFKNTTSVTDECRLLSTSCIILLLTFTGMRINEVLNIKKDGYREINTEPKLYIVRSYETKISGGQTVDYITSPIIKDVFNILIRLQSTTLKYEKKIKDQDKLFVSSNHQKLISHGCKSQIIKNIKNFIVKFEIKLKEEDLKEHKLLNQINGKDIKVGDYWEIGTHQFRRTLITNFVSHNLSSINEVKQQVKHMYATMTEYYAKNSNLIEYFNLKQPESILDSIQEEILNENVRRYKDFYYSDNNLSGNKGKEILKERKTATILSDEDIKLMFKTGAYKLTKSPYGYCTKGNDCDKTGVVDPTFCGASCETMIITKENAEQWKKLYIRNEKLLNMKADSLIIGDVKMDGALTMMKSQNQVAKKILMEFGIEV